MVGFLGTHKIKTQKTIFFGQNPIFFKCSQKEAEGGGGVLTMEMRRKQIKSNLDDGQMLHYHMIRSWVRFGDKTTIDRGAQI